MIKKIKSNPVDFSIQDKKDKQVIMNKTKINKARAKK